MAAADDAAASPEEAQRRHEERMDPRGCLFFGVRYVGCALTLYILMFTAILIAAVVGRLLFGG